MQKLTPTLIKRGLLVAGGLGAGGRPCLGPVAQARRRRCRGGDARAPSSSPSTRRARPASRTSTRCRRRSPASWCACPLEAGDRVKKDVTHRCHHRADGAALPRCAHAARARGAGRSRQGRRGARRGGNRQAAVGARVRRERAQPGARPDPHQDDLRARARAGAHRRRHPARLRGAGQVQPGGAQARAGERAGEADRARRRRGRARCRSDAA